MTGLDPGPVSREEAVEAAQAILAEHQAGGRCWRCRPDGSCAGCDDAGARLADERDRLHSEGRTDHPLFGWPPGGVREALRAVGAVAVTRDTPPHINPVEDAL